MIEPQPQTSQLSSESPQPVTTDLVVIVEPSLSKPNTAFLLLTPSRRPASLKKAGVYLLPCLSIPEHRKLTDHYKCPTPHLMSPFPHLHCPSCTLSAPTEANLTHCALPASESETHTKQKLDAGQFITLSQACSVHTCPHDQLFLRAFLYGIYHSS